MNAIRQKCRPKHQVLVLKCYPRTTKGAVDVKPNSSELSYLLFYATSRKTKIQKVASFLEKKTASDVWRLRIGNVQVTLQILEALIEKSPKDLPLFAPTVLKILDLVLTSNDITMVESSLPTFEAFCAHHDASSLFADQAYYRQYEAVVRLYAALASTRGAPGKGQPSKPVAMRWRSAGLEAIRSVASSDALSSVAGRQYDVIVPMILENLWTDNEDFLDVLLQRAQLEEKVGAEKLLKRRNSVATVRTADTVGDTNPIALSGSATDVDKLAEEEVGVLAMQCLKQIFVAPNRSQIHAATQALLAFIEERVSHEEPVVRTFASTGRDGGWALKMMGLVSRWAPVQDRYVILVTTMDSMVRTPMREEKLQQHLVLAAMVGALLRSDVNLIGLSVMDVLLGFMQQIKRLVQMPGDPSGGGGTRAAGDEATTPFGQDSEPKPPTTVEASDEVASSSSAERKALLGRIEQCIGDLATHVYYTDQTSDMISAILLRLRPARSNSPANSSPHVESAEGGAAVITGPATSAASSVDEHQVDSLFSLATAKTAALRAIKKILLVANARTRTTGGGNVGLSRNRVPIQVWEGTQWLLRDPEGQVRKAYADALLTWLDQETTKADMKARDESASQMRSLPKHATSAARRVVSSASQQPREKPTKAPRSHFLALLHVAIHDNALQWLDYETDVILLHVLLFKLVSRLGVNAARYGLPMVFRMQEAIQEVETPLSKVRLGCLCHGYFWALTEVFDLEASVVGRAIHNEIIRRRSKHFWIEGIHIPPPPLELIGTLGVVGRPEPKLPLIEVESEALLPFDDRISLVECICTAYQEADAASPPPPPPLQSPAASPGRSFALPILGSSLGGSDPAVEAEADNDIPSSYREQMLNEWSREAVLTAMRSGSTSASLSGSRSGTTGTNRNRLAVDGGAMANGHPPSPHTSQRDLRPLPQPVGNNNNNNLSPMANLRKSSVRSGVSPSVGSSSSRAGGAGPAGGFVTSVDQLKMVLSGDLRPQNVGTAHGAATAEDDDSDSMVSYDMTPSELSFNPGQQPESSQVGATGDAAAQRERTTLSAKDTKGSVGEGLGPLNSHPTHENGTIMEDEAGGENGEGDGNDDVDGDAESAPPVPPLPSNLAGGETSAPIKAQESATTGSTTPRPATARRSVKTSAGAGGENGLLSASPTSDSLGGGAMDLQSLLMGIDSGSKERSIRSMTKPPY